MKSLESGYTFRALAYWDSSVMTTIVVKSPLELITNVLGLIGPQSRKIVAFQSSAANIVPPTLGTVSFLALLANHESDRPQAYDLLDTLIMHGFLITRINRSGQFRSFLGIILQSWGAGPGFYC